MDIETTQPMIVIRFTVNGEFSDALNLTPEEHTSLTEQDILDMQQARYDNWKKAIATQSEQPPIQPTREEIKQQLAEIEQVKAELEAKLNG